MRRRMKERLRVFRRLVHRIPLLFPLYYHLLYMPVLIIKKWLMLGSEGLTDEQKGFLTANRRKWLDFAAESPPEQGYILVDALLHFPNPHLLTNSVIGKYLARKYQRKTVFLLCHWYDRRVKKIAASYGADDFIYLHNKKIHPVLQLRSLWDALRLHRRVKTGGELLALEYDGIPVGDLIYDTYLRKTREGTIARMNWSVFPVLYDAILTRRYYQRVFRRFPLRAAVLGDAIYSELGILARTCLQNGAEVYTRKRLPPSRIRMRRYRNLAEIRTSADRPPQALVDFIYQRHQTEAVSAAEDYLRRRMDAALPELSSGDVPLAYGFGKTLLGRDEIVSRLNLAAGKPIAVIMSHALIDAVHSNRRLLFRDYLTWLRATLDLIRDCPETNWLVKPHPSAEAYNCRQKEKNEVARAILGRSGHTISLLPDDVSAKSLLDFADYLVTARGTAGLEFSCFGIPCILAGESPYSGFGFTMEPGTKEEYFQLLRNINHVPKLGAEQVIRAKVVAYLCFVLLGAETGFLLKDMPLANMPILGELDEEMVWREIMASIQKLEPATDGFYQKLDAFLDSGMTHLLGRPEFYPEIAAWKGSVRDGSTRDRKEGKVRR
ncbi:hypothetical protein ACFLWN_01000 [Chloroflexota bacterium]